MTTYTYRFQEVTHPVSRRLKCRTCGKRFTRSRTFTQTINPFNKNANGLPKTRAEIARELSVKAAEWQPVDLCTEHAEAATR